MSKPRTLKGYKTRITEVGAELEQAKVLLKDITEVDDEYDNVIEKITELEIQLATLNEGMVAMDKGDETPEPEPEQDKPEAGSLLGKSALVRCARETNVMVNPFNPNVKIVGHSITEVVVDSWMEAQIKAGILVARL